MKEITVVQFKQLRTTTPRKQKNEGPHLYNATNEHIDSKYTINTPLAVYVKLMWICIDLVIMNLLR